MSLDCYIAGADDDMSFLSLVEKKGEDYGYSEFISTIDTVIMGRRTYDWIISMVPEFPHKDIKTYILTSGQRQEIGNCEFYSGDLNKLITELKAKPGLNIFCDGGAETVHSLLRLELIDELIISVIPVLLGKGIKLFKPDEPEQRLEFLSVRHFESGLVQLHYKVKRN